MEKLSPGDTTRPEEVCADIREFVTTGTYCEKENTPQGVAQRIREMDGNARYWIRLELIKSVPGFEEGSLHKTLSLVSNTKVQVYWTTVEGELTLRNIMHTLNLGQLSGHVASICEQMQVHRAVEILLHLDLQADLTRRQKDHAELRQSIDMTGKKRRIVKTTSSSPALLGQADTHLYAEEPTEPELPPLEDLLWLRRSKREDLWGRLSAASKRRYIEEWFEDVANRIPLLSFLNREFPGDKQIYRDVRDSRRTF